MEGMTASGMYRRGQEAICTGEKYGVYARGAIYVGKLCSALQQEVLYMQDKCAEGIYRGEMCIGEEYGRVEGITIGSKCSIRGLQTGVITAGIMCRRGM